jgi:hypothetical protein
MGGPAFVEAGDLAAVVGWRGRCRRVRRAVVSRIAPATSGSMLSAVGSVLAGQPSSRRTSLGDSTPA